MTQTHIQILDPTTANQIAAGEVVERPASVVKELLENAIDAGSSRITVTTEQGGRLYIQVEDDGCGMTAEELDIAVQRHATSKLRQIEDLQSLQTLGFRGEALPSIASVSHFKIFSRIDGQDLGVCLTMADGQQIDKQPMGGPKGTVVTVKNLFYNTPARLKFLKTMATEAGRVADVVSHMALAYPQIAFQLRQNNKLVLSTVGDGQLEGVIDSLFGPQISSQLVFVNYEEQGIHVNGYVVKPSQVKSNRNYQIWIVNGRVVKSLLLSRSLENAYSHLLPGHGHPVAVLNIRITADCLDVNVHPTKNEVKFANEQQVFLALYHAVKQALQPQVLAAEGTTTREIGHGEKLDPPLRTASAQPGVLFASQTSGVYRPPVAEVQKPLWVLNESQVEHDLAYRSNRTAPQSTEPKHPFFNQLQILGQVAETYLVARMDHDLYIIDQHAAHERIMYEQFSQRAATKNLQQLLIPCILHVSFRESAAVHQNMDQLMDAGFSLEEFGEDTFRVTAVPNGLAAEDVETILQEVITSLTELPVQTCHSDRRERIIMTAACKAAVKANCTLSYLEMDSLLRQLSDVDQPYTCPHGRPTVIHITPEELAKRFKRT